MFRPDVLVRQALSLFRRIRQHTFALVRQGEIDRSGNLLPNGGMTLNLFANRFNRSVGAEKAIGQRFILTQEPKQQMLGLDIRGTKLAGLIPCKEDDAPRLFCIPFEHVPPKKFPRRAPLSTSTATFL